MWRRFGHIATLRVVQVQQVFVIPKTRWHPCVTSYTSSVQHLRWRHRIQGVGDGSDHNHWLDKRFDVQKPILDALLPHRCAPTIQYYWLDFWRHNRTCCTKSEGHAWPSLVDSVVLSFHTFPGLVLSLSTKVPTNHIPGVTVAVVLGKILIEPIDAEIEWKHVQNVKPRRRTHILGDNQPCDMRTEVNHTKRNWLLSKLGW